jgi:Ca2+-binding EF-hand superfamily protein
MPLSSTEIRTIEEAVRDKIRMKSNGVENAEPLKRAFKHFDTDQSGTVDLDEFTRAMEPLQ